MDQLITNQFSRALVFLLEKEGRGAQIRLAREKEIDRGYLNAIIQGRKTGSEHVRGKISDHFQMPYEEMLALGRRLLEGPEQKKRDWTGQIGEQSPDTTEKVPGEISEDSGVNPGSPRISETIQKAIVILETDSEYRFRLADLIDTFHKELMARKESTGLRSQLEELENRIAQLEKKLSDE
jgi:polyhydroxyalkanoate synthesis regulator phasin